MWCRLLALVLSLLAVAPPRVCTCPAADAHAPADDGHGDHDADGHRHGDHDPGCPAVHPGPTADARPPSESGPDPVAALITPPEPFAGPPAATAPLPFPAPPTAVPLFLSGCALRC